MRTRRSLTVAVIIPLLLGIVSLNRVMGQARFAGYYKPDVLQLVGAGICFGVAMVAVISLVRMSRTDRG